MLYIKPRACRVGAGFSTAQLPRGPEHTSSFSAARAVEPEAGACTPNPLLPPAVGHLSFQNTPSHGHTPILTSIHSANFSGHPGPRLAPCTGAFAGST